MRSGSDFIGREWVTCADRLGRRRIDDPDDHVRIEVETLLAQPDVRVIPVFVKRVETPNAEDLPNTLQPLLRRNGIRIRSSGVDFKNDIGHLRSVVGDIVRTVRSARETREFAATEIGNGSADAPIPRKSVSPRSARRMGEQLADVVILFTRRQAEAEAKVRSILRDLDVMVWSFEDPVLPSGLQEDRAYKRINDALLVIALADSVFGSGPPKQRTFLRDILGVSLEREKRKGKENHLVIIVNVDVEPHVRVSGLPKELQDRGVFNCPLGILTEEVKNLVVGMISRYYKAVRKE